MDGLSYVKSVLIQPFYSEEGEGRRIKYVLEMKDNFLQGTTLLKNLSEYDLLREYLDSSYTPTELIYKGTKDGF